MTRLEERLAVIPSTMPSTPPATIRAPQGRGAPTAFRPELAVHFDGSILFDGDVTTAAALPDRVAMVRRNWVLLHPNEPTYPAELYVWADERVTLQAVHNVLRHLTDHSAWLLVQDPSSVIDLPCPPSIEGGCAFSDRPQAEAATAMAEATRHVIRRCEPIKELFRAIAGAGFDAAAELFRSGAPNALRECECDVDMEAFEYLVIEGLGGSQPASQILPIPQTDLGRTVGEYAAMQSPSPGAVDEL